MSTDPSRAAEPSPEVALRLDELERRLIDTQALVTRTYQRLAAEDQLVASARLQPEYARAWDEDPLVSVRTATYRGAAALVDVTLPSLIRQTYTNWEALVVGDDTDDDTADRIAALGDDRIRFHNLPFRGPYPDAPRDRWYVAGIPPLLHATRAARGSWLATLDHDDQWEPDHLERLLDQARATRAEVVYGRIRVRDAAGQDLDVLGTFPPVRGQFGFLGAIVHSSLRGVTYDMNCRFAGEPGDWNVARRLWEAGARFSFLERVVATQNFEFKPGSLTGADLLLSELQGWTAQVVEAKEHWEGQAESWRLAAADLQSQLSHQQAAVEELRGQLSAAVAAGDELRAALAASTEERDRWRATAEEPRGLGRIKTRLSEVADRPRP